MKIVTSSSAGIRPRLLNIEEINEAMALAIKLNAPMKVYLHFYFYQSAFDKQNFDEAEEHLKNYEPSAILPKAQVFASEAAMYSLTKDKAALHTKIEMALKEIPNMMDRGVGIGLRVKLVEMNKNPNN